MGLWTQIYTSSQKFNRQLRGGSSRPGFRPPSVHHESDPLREVAQFVCPKCTEPTPPGITCERCGVVAVDRFTRRRTHVLGGLVPGLWLRRIAQAFTARAEEHPCAPIAKARGLSRIRGEIVEIREAVDGRAAWTRLLRRQLISDVGSFVIRDETGTLLVGSAVQEFRMMPSSTGYDLGVGDHVELVGKVTPAEDGAYRSGHAVLSGDLWDPVLLRPCP